MARMYSSPQHTISAMEPGQENFGECMLCHGSFHRDGVSAHLRACMRRKAGDADAAGLHVRAESVGACLYWMNLWVRLDATLEDLDRFLRKTWLEPCCGHLSGYHVGPVSYMHRDYAWGMFPDTGVEPMAGIAVGDVLHPKAEAEHEYDFGTATHTRLRAISHAPRLPGRAKVRLLARNDPPAFPCTDCAKRATLLCAGCFIEGEAALCNDCAARHDCEYDQDALVPVVNSPRTGVCGYTGPEKPRRGTWVYDPDAATAMRSGRRGKPGA